jgi:hypothetical protein
VDIKKRIHSSRVQRDEIGEEISNTKEAIRQNPDIMDNLVVPQKAPDLMDFLGNL